MKISVILFSLLVIIGLLSCSSKKTDLPPGVHMVIVKEKTNAEQYSYLNVTEGNGNFWIAVLAIDVNPGDTLYYSKSMEMKNFSSKTLKKTFDSIFFVEDATKKLISTKPATQHPKVETKKDETIKLTPATGGITVAQAYKERDKYVGQTVKIIGKVTKYNPEIMNRNWIHIQDGTEDGNNFDLLVTSKDLTNLGDVIEVTGKLVTNQDFGAGYKYDVMIENATIAKEQ